MIPKHIAFIMDGNRRFAKRQRIATAGGHAKGFDKVVCALEWCLDLGVPCVSMYAFSLENFRRSPSEVATLMSLAEDRLLALPQEELVHRHGVRIKVSGDLSRVPLSVAHAANRAMEATACYSKCVLNICLAYTSTDEMSKAVEAVQQQVTQGSLLKGDVSLSHIEEHLFTADCPRVDLVIRTSGETRLSDFLLHQSSAASLHFTSSLWPDFSFTDLLAAFCQFQREAPLAAALATAASTCAERGQQHAAGDASAAAPSPNVTVTATSTKVQSKRSIERCSGRIPIDSDLRNAGHSPTVSSRTGLISNPVYSPVQGSLHTTSLSTTDIPTKAAAMGGNYQSRSRQPNRGPRAARSDLQTMGAVPQASLQQDQSHTGYRTVATY